MKTLIAYYSRSGITKTAADNISELLDSDTEHILDVKPRKGIWGFLKSGYEASAKKLAEIKKTKKNPADYDLVIVACPVWAGLMSSPMRTYLNAYKQEIKKYAVVLTLGGGSSIKAIQDIETYIGNKSTVNLVLKAANVKSGNSIGRIREFVDKLKEKN